MSQNQNNNSGCLISWGDDFLPMCMFFFHLNVPNPTDQRGEEDDDQIFIVK